MAPGASKYKKNHNNDFFNIRRPDSYAGRSQVCTSMPNSSPNLGDLLFRISPLGSRIPHLGSRAPNLKARMPHPGARASHSDLTVPYLSPCCLSGPDCRVPFAMETSRKTVFRLPLPAHTGAFKVNEQLPHLRDAAQLLCCVVKSMVLHRASPAAFPGQALPPQWRGTGEDQVKRQDHKRA